MKNLSLSVFVIVIAFFVSCKKEEQIKPKVIYETPSKNQPLSQGNSAKIEVADLPINMEGTNFLIYPIGDLPEESSESKVVNDSDDSFTISNYGEYQITGYLKNLKFQEIGKDSIYALTNKPVLIETATYLKTVFDKTKQQILVYTLADIDTNKDAELDSRDIKSLYISTVSGKNFAKLSPDLQELADWNIVEKQNRLYFRTIEDTNKNGAFDKGDNLHYFFVNVLDTTWKAQEYNPIK